MTSRTSREDSHPLGLVSLVNLSSHTDTYGQGARRFSTHSDWCRRDEWSEGGEGSENSLLFKGTELLTMGNRDRDEHGDRNRGCDRWNIN